MDQTDSPAKSSVAFVEIVLAVLMTAVVVAVGVSAYRTFSIRSEVDDTLSATRPDHLSAPAGKTLW